MSYACSICGDKLSSGNKSGRCKWHPVRQARRCGCGRKVHSNNRTGKCQWCLYPRYSVPEDRKDDYDYLVHYRRVKPWEALAMVLAGPIERLSPIRTVTITTKEVLAAVSEATGIHPRDITGEGKFGFQVEARSACAVILRNAGMSYPMIARRLGRKDHSTIIHAIRKFNLYANRNPDIRAAVERFAA